MERIQQPGLRKEHLNLTSLAQHLSNMRHFQKSDIKKAIEKSGGIISLIASRLKCDWHTAKKYIKEFDLETEMMSEKESMRDIAESKLLENIKLGDNTAIIFFLKTQAKDRGYGDESRLNVNMEQPLFGPAKDE